MTSTSVGEIILYFVRHAECVGNVARTIPPPDKDTLTIKGKSQAEKLGVYFADIPFTRAYASDFSRTLETAQLILKHSKHLSADSIKKDVRIREQNPGTLEGRSYKDILIEVIRSKTPVLEFKVPGGEDFLDVHKRVEIFLAETFSDLEKCRGESSSNQNVLIVSHSFCLSHLMRFLNKSDEYFLVNWNSECQRLMRNTGYMKLKLSKYEGVGIEEGGKAKWKLEFLEIHGLAHLGEEDAAESEEIARTNEILIALMATTGSDSISGCIQT